MSVENPWEKSENPSDEEVAKLNREKIKERRDRMKETATETQKGVAEAQAEKLETALLRLMERTGDNKEIVNNLNSFINALEHQSGFGDSNEPLHEGRARDIANFLEEAAKALRWTVGQGNRPTDLNVDFSKWETKKHKAK